MKSFVSTLLGAVAAAALAAAAAPPAHAQWASDVEAARARARAGGPISEEDRYLLQQYGALSGTPGFSPGGTRRLKRYDHRGGDRRRPLTWEWLY